MIASWKDFPDRLLADISLWSANLANLQDSVRRVDEYADLYHFDVSDGHYTPSLLFFPDLIAAVRPLTRKPLHVHLMVERPREQLDRFVSAGADILTVHLEHVTDIRECLAIVKSHNCSAGLAVQLQSDLNEIASLVDLIDLVLLMATPLGTKGQSPSPSIYRRLREVKAMLHGHWPRRSREGGGRWRH